MFLLSFEDTESRWKWRGFCDAGCMRTKEVDLNIHAFLTSSLDRKKKLANFTLCMFWRKENVNRNPISQSLASCFTDLSPLQISQQIHRDSLEDISRQGRAPTFPHVRRLSVIKQLNFDYPAKEAHFVLLRRLYKMWNSELAKLYELFQQPGHRKCNQWYMEMLSQNPWILCEIFIIITITIIIIIIIIIIYHHYARYIWNTPRFYGI